MRKKLLFIVICVFALPFMTGCKDQYSTNPDNANGPTDGIIPLNIGAKWTYKVWDTEESYTYDEVISGIVTYGAYDHWVRQRLEEGYATLYDAILVLDDSYQIYPVESNSTYTDYFYELPYPANIGDKFYYFVDGADSTHGEVDDIAATLTIDLGTFSCYRYHVWNENESTTLYYSPGVGLIKSTSYRAGSNRGPEYLELIKTENISYEVFVDTTQAQ